MTRVAASRAEVTKNLQIVSQAAEELQRELERHPLRSDISVCIEIAGAVAYYISGGCLRPAAGLKDSIDSIGAGSKASASLWEPNNAHTRELQKRVVELESELERRTCDVRIAFRDEHVLADIVTRARDAFEQNDLPRILSSMLCEVSLPTWSSVRDVEVSGVSSLARLLWSAWLSRESDSASTREQQTREKSKQDWVDDDLSQGWVIVHSVSPGIKERVSVFQTELDQLPLSRDQESRIAEDDEANWMELLVKDLRQAAEQFHETVAAGGTCVAPDPNIAPATSPACSEAKSGGYGACAKASTSASIASGSGEAGVVAGSEAGRSAPPRSSLNFF